MQLAPRFRTFAWASAFGDVAKVVHVRSAHIELVGNGVCQPNGDCFRLIAGADSDQRRFVISDLMVSQRWPCAHLQAFVDLSRCDLNGLLRPPAPGVRSGTVALSSLETMGRWPGLATYILTENKFRLFKRLKPSENDYGLAYFDHMGRILMSIGVPGAMGAMIYRLLLLFVTVITAEKENRQPPQTHGNFMSGYLARFADGSYPGAAFLAAPFAALSSPDTYETGVAILLYGFEELDRARLKLPPSSMMISGGRRGY